MSREFKAIARQIRRFPGLTVANEGRISRSLESGKITRSQAQDLRSMIGQASEGFLTKMRRFAHTRFGRYLTFWALFSNLAPVAGRAAVPLKKPAIERRIDKETVKNAKLAIIVVDMQDSYLKDIDMKEKEKEIKNQLEVLDFAKEYDVPVYVLEMAFEGTTTDTLGFRSKLDSLHAKTFTKRQDDGFHEESFSRFVESQDRKNLLIMGLNASACVLWTAYGALQQGYTVMTSKDLIMDPVAWNLENKKKGVIPESVDTFKEYTVYHDSHKELLQAILNGNINRSPDVQPASR